MRVGTGLNIPRLPTTPPGRRNKEQGTRCGPTPGRGGIEGKEITSGIQEEPPDANEDEPAVGDGGQGIANG
jgi:hypothetical protein